jgi:hypothetical protein
VQAPRPHSQNSSAAKGNFLGYGQSIALAVKPLVGKSPFKFGRQTGINGFRQYMPVLDVWAQRYFRAVCPEL